MTQNHSPPLAATGAAVKAGIDKYLKVRLPAAEYQQLAQEADLAGMTVSSYVRRSLQQQRQTLLLEDVLAKLDARLSTPAAPSAPPANNRQLDEILLLARELAADRNAQILARVAAKLKTQTI